MSQEKQTEEFLTFKLADGALYGLPVRLIADHRAKYYAESDPSTTYQEEFDYVMSYSREACDWFFNNMNPEDFKEKDYILLEPAKSLTFFEKLNSALDNGCDYEIEEYPCQMKK